MNYLKKELYQLVKTDDAIFEFLQNSSLDGLWYWDLQNPDQEWMNARFWETLGYDPAEMPHLASAWQDIIHPKDLTLATENAKKHFADPNHPYDQVVRYTHKNGSIVWIRCRGLAIRDENGVPVRMLGAHVDITAEKEKEMLLTKTNKIAKIGVWEYNLRKETLYWNDLTRAIHEVPDDFIPNVETGINFYKEGTHREKVAHAVKECIENGVPYDIELILVTAKNNERWVRAIGDSEFINGKCVRMYGVFQDIHERKTIEFKLENERKFLRTLIDHIPVNVFVKDLESRKILINKMELEHMKIDDPNEVLGKSDFDLYPIESAQVSRDEDLKVFNTGEAMLNQETLNILKDGTENYFLTSKIPIRDEKGEISGLLGVSHNISSLKRAEEQQRKISILESKSKEMEQFAYVASHDLREPLLTIQGFAEVIQEDYSDELNEEVQSHLQVILEATKRMDNLIYGLLDYSRLSKMKQLQEVDVTGIVASVKADLHATIQNTGAIIHSSDLPTIEAYPLELKLVFQNLISNAIKFQKTGETPIIQISCKSIEDGWQFSIQDNGIGMPEKDLDQIFLIFKRLHKKTDYQGTGIGLANCRKIIELHNGEIWATSEIDKGSTFHFTVLTNIEDKNT